MGKIAFLFAGQGAQHPGMGKELVHAQPVAKQTFDELESAMPGLSKLCFEGTKEELTRTENTQPAIFATDLAAARSLVARGINPDGVAGFSLGEVAALTFACAFSDMDGFALVRYRGELMAEACAAKPGGMRAVVKLTAAEVERLAKEAGAWPVNYNSPQQTVVAGSDEALAKLDVLVKEAKGRSLKVAVAGAFHSPYMESASAGLAKWLENKPPRPCIVDVWANKTAEPYPKDPSKIAEVLAAQPSSPVLWTKTLENMQAAGFDSFVEVGPGTTLTGLVKRTLKGVTALSIETPEQLEAALGVLRKD